MYVREEQWAIAEACLLTLLSFCIEWYCKINRKLEKLNTEAWRRREFVELTKRVLWKATSQPGVEPGIFWPVVRRVIHCATGPTVTSGRITVLEKGKLWHHCCSKYECVKSFLSVWEPEKAQNWNRRKSYWFFFLTHKIWLLHGLWEPSFDVICKRSDKVFNILKSVLKLKVNPTRQKFYDAQKEEKPARSRQDSNLRGETPMDF